VPLASNVGVTGRKFTEQENIALSKWTHSLIISASSEKK
jgi:hypothetical protein